MAKFTQLNIQGTSMIIMAFKNFPDLVGSCQCLQPPELRNTYKPLAASAKRGCLSSRCCFVPTWLCICHSLSLESYSLHLALTNSCSSL